MKTYFLNWNEIGITCILVQNEGIQVNENNRTIKTSTTTYYASTTVNEFNSLSNLSINDLITKEIELKAQGIDTSRLIIFIEENNI